MTTAQAFLTGSQASSHVIFHVEEMAQLGVQAVFRARSVATTPTILAHLERRDRIVLLLLDGKRTLQDVARLTHHSNVEVAHILVRLLKRGYIEFLGAPLTDTDQ